MAHAVLSPMQSKVNIRRIFIMTRNQSKSLRVVVIITLILLTIQYEMGMEINFSPNLPELPAFGFSLMKIWDALHQAGTVAMVHAVLGSLLTFLSILSLILSLRSKMRSVQILGLLGLLSVALAATGCILFTLSGFQNDDYSLAMASNFILSFIFYFLELYFLKPDPKTQDGSGRF
jgi:hypothetical protein